MNRSPVQLLVFSALILLGFGSVVSVSADSQPNNSLFELLVNQGVSIGDAFTAKLPPPTLSTTTTAFQPAAVLDEVAGKIPTAEFTRNSWTARFPMKLQSIEDSDGNRIGQSIDVYFVAYGTIPVIRDNELIRELSRLNRKTSREDDDGSSRALTNKELSARGIKLTGDDGNQTVSESYYFFEGPVLDKVQLSGVTRMMVTYGPSSVIGSIMMDPRFIGDADYPSRWQPRTRNSQGGPELGPAVPYAGFGGYVKATELSDPAGAVLVEMHFVFDEPNGWFGGRNLLRAKLPLVIKENVQAFRKKLKDITGQ